MTPHPHQGPQRWCSACGQDRHDPAHESRDMEKVLTFWARYGTTQMGLLALMREAEKAERRYP